MKYPRNIFQLITFAYPYIIRSWRDVKYLLERKGPPRKHRR